MKTRLQQQEQVQETEQISEELVQKFDGDRQLVQEFIKEGYSVEELQGSTITHPTRYDPLVMIGDHTAGFYISPPNEEKYMDNSRLYKNRTNRFF